MIKIVKCPKCGKSYPLHPTYFGDQSKCKDCRAVNESGKAFVYRDEWEKDFPRPQTEKEFKQLYQQEPYYEERSMDKHFCMCTKLKGVARDCWSTCSICGGKDAYGKSPERPKKKQKDMTIDDIVNFRPPFDIKK
jgi:hypothetical protein